MNRKSFTHLAKMYLKLSLKGFLFAASEVLRKIAGKLDLLFKAKPKPKPKPRGATKLSDEELFARINKTDYSKAAFLMNLKNNTDDTIYIRPTTDGMIAVVFEPGVTKIYKCDQCEIDIDKDNSCAVGLTRYCLLCHDKFFDTKWADDLNLSLKFDVAVAALQRIVNASPKECGQIANAALNILQLTK